MGKFKNIVSGKVNATVFMIVGGIIVVAIVVAIIAFLKRENKSTKFRARIVDADIGGEVPKNWSPQNITNELQAVIYAYFATSMEREDAARRFNSVNDNQRIEIYNDWAARYYPEDNETLTQAVKAEIIKGQNWAIMEANLDRLNLP